MPGYLSSIGIIIPPTRVDFTMSYCHDMGKSLLQDIQRYIEYAHIALCSQV